MDAYDEATLTSLPQPPSDPLLEVPSPTPDIVILNIPLERLTLSPASRRKMNDRSVRLLAGRIRGGAQIQSLMVVPGEGGKYYVVAGERRLAALQLLLEQGRIEARYLVACRLIKALPAAESVPLLAEDAPNAYSAGDEKRRRFADLRHRCPGLLTGSEFAARHD